MDGAVSNSLLDDLIKIIDNGWDIKIYNQVKRMDDGRGYRNFVVRVCWEAENDEKRIECDWEGFEDTKKAIKDLINKCSTNATNVPQLTEVAEFGNKY